ncbi:MAG: winged helix-turn-helix domain-containing protein [Nitrososphaerota archaeon]|nr:winged helix-turn-helix domain-containing protein [Nitrososphaerota archaeon]
MLTWLITKTTGGKTRVQIIKSLKNAPQNANQLSTELKLSYKTICHHLKILQKNKLLTTINNTYTTIYQLSKTMEENYHLFEDLINIKPLNVTTF